MLFLSMGWKPTAYSSERVINIKSITEKLENLHIYKQV